MSRAKHKRRRFQSGRASIVLIAVASLLVAGGGSVFAAYRYDLANASRILPGVTVAGVAVGGMTRDEAIRAVAEKADLSLSSDLVVQAAGKSWDVTPSSLGVQADVDGAVDQALGISDSMTFVSRVYHRLTGSSVELRVDLPYSYDEAKIQNFVQQAYRRVSKPAQDAEMALVDGQVVRHHARSGQELKEGLAVQKIRAALQQQVQSVTIPVKSVAPEVTDSQLGYTIVVKISQNRLYLYKGLKLVKSYPVATAKPGFVTPLGSWTIVNKVENPTWINPAPDGWGAGEPAVIQPGPGNPLGTRAMYLNASGIRIHGTYDSGSIGTYASHGCIRMFISDSEELYSIAPIGTSVLIVA